MNKQTTLDEAYIGLDLHATKSVFGVIDSYGKQYKKQHLPTDPARMDKWLRQLSARRKYLAVEEGPLTQWISWQLREAVDELVVCDPKQNYLISHSAVKTDSVDTFKLARLLRLGELHSVWHPAQKDQRAFFAETAGHYIKMRSHQVRLKQQIKALYRRWGVLRVEGEGIYSKEGRIRYLEQVEDGLIHRQLDSYYAIMDQAVQAQAAAKVQLFRMGKSYPEIMEFRKVPGVGGVGAHLFDGLVQTPHRFSTASKLWRWGKLGVTDRSSNGKPLGYKKLDSAGRSAIKDISYRAWKAGAMQAKEPNEVQRYYQKSLKESRTATAARLNTQRKILKVLWTLWRKELCYDPDLF